MAFPANTTRYLLFLCNLLFLVSSVAFLIRLENCWKNSTWIALFSGVCCGCRYCLRIHCSILVPTWFVFGGKSNVASGHRVDCMRNYLLGLDLRLLRRDPWKQFLHVYGKMTSANLWDLYTHFLSYYTLICLYEPPYDLQPSFAGVSYQCVLRRYGKFVKKLKCF